MQVTRERRTEAVRRLRAERAPVTKRPSSCLRACVRERLQALVVFPRALELVLDHGLGVPRRLRAEQADAGREAGDGQNGHLADAEGTCGRGATDEGQHEARAHLSRRQ